MKKIIVFLFYCFLSHSISAQIKWRNIDSSYQPLPSSVHVFKSVDSIEGKPNVMYYAVANVKDKNLDFTTDTTYKRRLTPDEFYKKNNNPLLVVNGSFFSFATNQNLNVVVKNGKLVSYNEETIPARGKDTLTYYHSFFGALGISKRRSVDVAWVYADSAKRFPYATERPVNFLRDSIKEVDLKYVENTINTNLPPASKFSKWRMQTVIGGGPVLLQNSEIKITNNEERKFEGNVANNREPRTAIGYTKDNILVILVCEGRSKNAAGLTLPQLAQTLKDIGCVEALNLDGGGSSCMLINGKETNSPSGKGQQRPVPSVFLIKRK